MRALGHRQQACVSLAHSDSADAATCICKGRGGLPDISTEGAETGRAKVLAPGVLGSGVELSWVPCFCP